MAQGEFTKEEAANVIEAVEQMFKEGIPKSKRLNFVGHLNDICLFLNAAKRAAPYESEKKEEVGHGG